MKKFTVFGFRVVLPQNQDPNAIRFRIESDKTFTEKEREALMAKIHDYLIAEGFIEEASASV